MVPKAGLEPARLTPPPPQDGVSTNSTTSAYSWKQPIYRNLVSLPKIWHHLLHALLFWVLQSRASIKSDGSLVLLVTFFPYYFQLVPEQDSLAHWFAEESLVALLFGTE